MKNKQIKLLEQEAIFKQENYFSFYNYFPIILACLLLLFFFAYGIMDTCITSPSFDIPGLSDLTGIEIEKTYGTFQVKNAFVNVIIWAFIGIVVAAITFLISKIVCSQRILTVLYLKKISDYCYNDSEGYISELERLYRLYTEGQLSRAEYEAAINAYDAKIKEFLNLK